MADFKGYVTSVGQQFESLAKQMGYPVSIGFIEIGDGKLPDSESPINRTRLVNPLKQFPAIVEQDAKNPGQWVATCYIPADDAINGAGYMIREIGCKLINQGNGILYAYRRVSDDWKPADDSGEAKSFIYKLRFIPSNGELLTPTIDPSVVLVSKEELARAMKAHENSRNHPDATEIDKGFSRFATQAEVNAAAADDVAVTPKKMANHYRRSNILGPVSQQNGMPTGAIIEQGSNANGSYIRFADGTQWCFAEVELILNVSKPNSFGSTAGQGYGPPDSEWHFPAPFVSKPKAWGNPVGGEDHGAVAAHVSQLTNTFGIRRAWRVIAGPLTVQYFAVGRWY